MFRWIENWFIRVFCIIMFNVKDLVLVKCTVHLVVFLPIFYEHLPSSARFILFVEEVIYRTPNDALLCFCCFSGCSCFDAIVIQFFRSVVMTSRLLVHWSASDALWWLLMSYLCSHGNSQQQQQPSASQIQDLLDLCNKPRFCGGSHTLTYPHRRITKLSLTRWDPIALPPPHTPKPITIRGP